MDVHLVDGTYELFRQFFGQRERSRVGPDGEEIGAVAGVVASVVTMLGEGATHLAVATDHRIESFRNEMWAGYKTSEGVAPELLAQFPILEASLTSLGVMVLAMDELEADDGLASAAAIAARSPEVDRVFIWTPDKDLAQCVSGERVVQVDRRAGRVIDEAAVVEKYGVEPSSIPDWLGLVGDSADGFPGLKGWGKQSAATVLRRYRHIEDIPLDPAVWDPEVLRKVRSAPALAERLREDGDLAQLFKSLATLRIDERLFADVDDLSWSGPRPGFEETADRLLSGGLVPRVAAVAGRRR